MDLPAAHPTYPPRQERPRKPDTAALHAKVRRLSPSLDPETVTFRAAVLLLTAVVVGQNVDKLARLTGYTRELVARCARRLVDNGVWKNGNTVRTWDDPETGPLAFWGDVGVAEGKLCRRMDETGALRWAPAGEWRKSYDFVPRQREEGTSAAYHQAVVPEEGPPPVTRPERRHAPPPAAPERPRETRADPEWIGGPMEETGERGVPYLGAREQFDRTVWFGMAES